MTQVDNDAQADVAAKTLGKNNKGTVANQAATDENNADDTWQQLQINPAADEAAYKELLMQRQW